MCWNIHKLVINQWFAWFESIVVIKLPQKQKAQSYFLLLNKMWNSDGFELCIATNFISYMTLHSIFGIRDKYFLYIISLWYSAIDRPQWAWHITYILYILIRSQKMYTNCLNEFETNFKFKSINMIWTNIILSLR